MAFLSAFYPQPVVKGTTAGTYAEGNHTHELDELEATGIAAGKVLTANGSNAATWEDSTGQVEEAPEDGIIYGRKDADWVDITEPANLQIRRGTAAEVDAITPLQGEPVWETDTKKLVVGDGSTAGGFPASKFPFDGTLRNPTGYGSNRPSPGYITVSPEVETVGGSFLGGPYVVGNARGAGAVDLQPQRTVATQVASGNLAFIAASERSTASGVQSAIIGCVTSTVSGTQSLLVAGDAGHSITGARSFGVRSTISAENGIGFFGTVDRRNMLAHGSSGNVNGFSARAQDVQFVLRGRTTSATPSELLINAGVYLTIPSNIALFGQVEICAIEETNATEAVHYIRKFAIQNLGGATSLIGSVTTVGTDHESQAGYDVAITADDTSDYLKISVTGDSSKTLRWIAVVRGCEMSIT